MAVTHTFVSAIADGGDATLVRPSNWNADHTIADDTITYAKIQNVSAASKLLGRGSAAGAGDVEEITVGTGLAMTGTTLSTSGSGTGDVVGPASAVDADIALFDGITGKLIKDSGVLLSAKQAADATLTALAAYNTDGLVTQTAADTFTGRTITGTTNQITVTNGNGVSGNPTLSVPTNSQLSIAKITNLTSNGLVMTVSGDGTLSSTQPVYALFAKTSLSVAAAATYTTPANARALFVQLVGAGGGGGGIDGVTSQAGFASGGNGGGYAEKFITSPSATYTYTVTVGGAGGTAGANNGTAGGTTSFTDGGATNMTGPGGNGGATMTSGTSLITQAPNTSAVIGTGGDLNFNGGFGGYGLRLSGSTGSSGAGGASMLGVSDTRGVNNATGISALNFGVGGGGAGCTDNTDRAGGAGGAGVIFVWEYK